MEDRGRGRFGRRGPGVRLRPMEAVHRVRPVDHGLPWASGVSRILPCPRESASSGSSAPGACRPACGLGPAEPEGSEDDRDAAGTGRHPRTVHMAGTALSSAGTASIQRPRRQGHPLTSAAPIPDRPRGPTPWTRTRRPRPLRRPDPIPPDRGRRGAGSIPLRGPGFRAGKGRFRRECMVKDAAMCWSTSAGGVPPVHSARRPIPPRTPVRRAGGGRTAGPRFRRGRG